MAERFAELSENDIKLLLKNKTPYIVSESSGCVQYKTIIPLNLVVHGYYATHPSLSPPLPFPSLPPTPPSPPPPPQRDSRLCFV